MEGELIRCQRKVEMSLFFVPDPLSRCLPPKTHGHAGLALGAGSGATEAQGQGRNSRKAGRAYQGLAWVQKLYRIERSLKQAACLEQRLPHDPGRTSTRCGDRQGWYLVKPLRGSFAALRPCG